MTKSPNQTSAAGNGQSPAGVHAGISAQLRAYYRSVEEEGIPDRFLSLLEKLDMAEKQVDNSYGIRDTA
ncbi:hypothetical protein J5N58_04305 [Rhizobium cremeum]|uniref:NepR family anti-sigma factor n=1 Tax=Rhizobium cremeum TaxID=2813827 RepID=UPI000DD94221|nr:NepR family anti-sigma factor [Rhizobium cremeum]MCJ7993834.1 hypothetical protein [Rhizobium cremeum]MCJ7998891.1 hypothetical protein [Rhizobium cremeum]